MHRSYSSILKEYGCTCMSMEASLKWAGSVIGMKSESLPNIMMFGELGERKKKLSSGEFDRVSGHNRF